MLARWFDRSGIGQMLAPDPDAAPVSENDECRSVVWQFLAPDDNFAPPKAPPREIFPPRISSVGSDLSTNVPQTPRTPAPTETDDGGDDLNSRVLSACRDTSMFMASPAPERKTNDKFLRFCASTKALNDKLMKKMRSMVTKDSFKDAYLLRVRATRLGESAPDGYTPLMVAAYANHMEAVKLIFQLAEEYAEASGDKTTYANLHLDRNMIGMTALHIAAQQGHIEMIQYLLPLYNFPQPPGTPKNTTEEKPNKSHVPLVDLRGQTAFGIAVTSPVPKAKKNQRALEKNLYSNNDLSIFGQAKPIGERMGTIKSLGLDYGISDMPGMRGYMEDAHSVNTWVQHGSSLASGEVTLFAVCDGHGDNGKVSDFITSNAATVLKECIDEYKEQDTDATNSERWDAVWRSACLKLDHMLKKAHLIEGGSTGVFALVTDQEIVVANVGDSRCILACKHQDPVPKAKNEAAIAQVTNDVNENDNGKNENATEVAELNAGAPAPGAANDESDSLKEGPPALVEEAQSTEADMTTMSESKERAIVVTALSEDHKPNLPDEEARVKMAGLDVKSIPIKAEDGTETYIHKVAKSEKDQLAVSRAFGDFDYKMNTQLSEVEQAVIPLADITVHRRRPGSDLYLLLACDGIWDVMGNEEVIDYVQAQMNAKADTSGTSLLPDVADVLLQECLHKESRDNMTAILVCLQPGNNTTNNTDTMAPKALDFGSPK